MDMEEMEEKRPRFLWIAVVAVVAAALAIFILFQSSRMEPQTAPAGTEPSVTQAPSPESASWPAPDTARALGRVPGEASQGTVETSSPRSPEPPPAVAVPAPGPRDSAAHPASPTAEPAPARPPASQPSDARPSTPAGERPLVLPASDTGPFVVQVGSFRDEGVADRQKTRMEAYGYRAWVEPVDIPQKGRMYRVRIGGFATAEDARRVADSLEKTLGTQCWTGRR